MRHGLELGPILHIRLDAQTGREDELADRGAEAGEEGVEGLDSDFQPPFHITPHPLTIAPPPPCIRCLPAILNPFGLPSSLSPHVSLLSPS